MATNHHNTSIRIKSVNVNRLGFFLDGWADLVEGMGAKVEEVTKTIQKILVDREMPDVDVQNVKASVGVTSGTRQYSITTTYPGATTTIYAGKYGNDLYVSWYTYIRPVLNIRILAILLAISAFFGLRAGVAAYSAGRGFASSGFFENLVSTTQIFIGAVAVFIGATLGAFVIEAVILSVLGFFFTRDPFWVFLVQPNVFDADDIAAMSLAAHKSILKALDRVGIDSSLLRHKQEFRRKRGEAI